VFKWAATRKLIAEAARCIAYAAKDFGTSTGPGPWLGVQESVNRYDLLVVVPDDALPEHRRSRLAYEVLRGTGAAADVLVCTRSYFDQRRQLKASLPGTVLREGRALHVA
jgi:hypothetical protein